MYPGLKISRSLGDLICHQIGVTSEPSITIMPLSSNDKFFVAASDGLWEHVGPDELIDLITEMNIGQRETYGQISQTIWQKLKDMATSDGAILNDTTFIISNFN